MDNLTHTLAGLALGRTLDRRPSAASAASVWTAIVASNLPDADSVAGLAGKIEYLVHHRGWTHTLVALPVMAALAAGAVLLFRRVRLGERPPGRDGLARLFGIAAASIALHIAMDGLNNYGIHPFAPFHRGWLYGDSVFILEPLLWWCLIPLAAAQAASQRRRYAWYACGVLGIGALGYVAGIPQALAATALGALMIRLQHRFPGVTSAWAGVAIVVAMFGIASQLVRARAAAATPPSEELLDVVRTPGPSNPFCWRVQTVSRDGADFIAREGVVSLAFGRARECWPLEMEERSAPLSASALPSTDALAWKGELRAPVAELRDRAADCRIAALLTFVRVPFWTENKRRAIFGDLRYDFGPGESFGEVELPTKPRGCPRGPWDPPRKDLLFD